MIAFQSPVFLLGLLAAAIPVLLHLIHRRRARVLKFPSLRLLKLIDARLSRRRRLHDIVLLFLRTAVLALVAVALARPLLDAPSSGSGDAPVACAVVIDDTLSMNFTRQGNTRFQRAVEFARKVLGTLGPGDAGLLALVSRPGENPLVHDPAALMERLDRLTPTFAAGDLRAALERAAKTLAGSGFPIRELYVITDMQERGGLDALRAGGRSRSHGGKRARRRRPLRVPAGVRVTFIDIATGASPNAAVLDARTTGPVVAGRETGIEARLANFSAAPVQRTLSLVVQGRVVLEQPVEIPPGGAKDAVRVVLLHRFEKPGARACAVRLSKDALHADDQRRLVVPVTQGLRVLLVNGAPSPTAYQDGAFYLRAALESEPGAGRKPLFRVGAIHPSKFPGDRVTGADVVALVNTERLSRAQVGALERFVRAGGGLVVFGGDRVSPKTYAEVFGEGEAALLPGRIAGTAGDAGLDDAEKRKRAVGLAPARGAHPVLAGLDRLLESALFFRRHRLDPLGAREVARFTSGYPAILERRLGRGTVLLAAFPADASWSNLPLKPLYLPLARRLMRRAAGAAEAVLETTPGRGLAFKRTEREAQVIVRLPGGGAERHLVPARGEDHAAKVASFKPGEPGIYTLSREENGLATDRLVVVNVDCAAESDLRRVKRDRAALAETLGMTTASVDLLGEQDFQTLGETIARERHGRALWPLFLALAVLAFLAESMLANWILPPRRAAGTRRASGSFGASAHDAESGTPGGGASEAPASPAIPAAPAPSAGAALPGSRPEQTEEARP